MARLVCSNTVDRKYSGPSTNRFVIRAERFLAVAQCKIVRFGIIFNKLLMRVIELQLRSRPSGVIGPLVYG